MNINPAAARRWQIFEGGKRYRFELRQDLRWSDGSPLTAHDFVFAWQRNLNPKTQAGLAYLLHSVQGAEPFHVGQTDNPDTIGIKAIDDRNLEITLKVPVGYFLYLLADPITFPQPAHIIKTNGDNWSQPENLVCNGPFKIESWKDGQEIYLRQNQFYRGFATGNLEKIVLQFIEPSLEHYEDNKIDWCRVEDQADLPASYPRETFLSQHLETYFVGFTCHHPPFSQKLIRQAFAQCINSPELVKEVWSDVQKPATGGVVPPGMPGHSPEIGLGFDPAKARDRLKQAGLDLSADLPLLTLVALPGFSTTPEYLQESWYKHLGIKVNLVENVPFDEMASGIQQGRFQLSLGSWVVDYPDPDDILRVLFHSASPANYFGWHNPRFDQLVSAAAGLSDHQQRLSLYHQADKILVTEDTAIIPLYYRQAYGLLRPGFEIEGNSKIVRGSALKLKNIVVNAYS